MKCCTHAKDPCRHELSRGERWRKQASCLHRPPGLGLDTQGTDQGQAATEGEPQRRPTLLPPRPTPHKRGSVSICGPEDTPDLHFHFLCPVPPPGTLITCQTAPGPLLTSGHSLCSWPSVLRKFVITKKEFPCREKERSQRQSLREQDCVITIIQLAKCPGANLSALLSFSLEIRVPSVTGGDTEGLISKLGEPPCRAEGEQRHSPADRVFISIPASKAAFSFFGHSKTPLN